MGINYFIELKNEEKKILFESLNEITKGLFYEINDLKYILFDIDGCCRGLAGVKKALNYNDLPSLQSKETIQIEAKPTKSEEERLERHKKFFEELKSAFSNK